VLTLETLFLELDRADRPRSDTHARSRSLTLFFQRYYFILFQRITREKKKQRLKKQHIKHFITDICTRANLANVPFGQMSPTRAFSKVLRKNESIKIICACVVKVTVIPPSTISNLANTWKRRKRRFDRPSSTKCSKFNKLLLHRYLYLSGIKETHLTSMVSLHFFPQ